MEQRQKKALINKKKFSTKQEKMVADSLGWDVVKGSGSRSLYPGDVSSSKWLGECKTHTEPNQRVKISYLVWEKIVDEAVAMRKYPALFVDDGSQKPSSTWCITSQLPYKPHIVFTFPFRISKVSFSFNHIDLIELTRNKEREFGKIIIYSVKYKKTKPEMYLYTFSSFVDCFGD